MERNASEAPPAPTRSVLELLSQSDTAVSQQVAAATPSRVQDGTVINISTLHACWKATIPSTTHANSKSLLLYSLPTSKVIPGWVHIMTVHTDGN